MKQFFLDYFTFNKIERNGIFILCAIIIALLFFDDFISIITPDEKVNYTEFEAEIDAFVQQKEKYKDSVSHVKEREYTPLFTAEKSSPPIKLFKFDPNSATQEQWLNLGLTQKQYSVINNYLLKGGKFYKKEDLKKIYGISNKLYLNLEPYINIENQFQKSSFKENENSKEKAEVIEKKESSVLMININLADTSELIQLKGIGSAFSLRIIKYRNSLGGFRNVNQLVEVYGVTEELVKSISPFITVDSTIIKKININNCQASDLKRHPYINNWNIANSIINLREQHGLYKTIADIKKSDLVNDELYLKLAPYLTLE